MNSSEFVSNMIRCCWANKWRFFNNSMSMNEISWRKPRQSVMRRSVSIASLGTWKPIFSFSNVPNQSWQEKIITWTGERSSSSSSSFKRCLNSSKNEPELIDLLSKVSELQSALADKLVEHEKQINVIRFSFRTCCRMFHLDHRNFSAIQSRLSCANQSARWSHATESNPHYGRWCIASANNTCCCLGVNQLNVEMNVCIGRLFSQ